MHPDLPGWSGPVFAFCVAPALALAAHAAVQAVVRRLLHAENASVMLRVMRNGQRSVALGLMLLAVLAAMPLAGLPGGVHGEVARGLTLALTATLGWALTRKTAAIFDAYIDRSRQIGGETLQSRRRRTQLVIFRRLAVTTGVVLTLGLVLTAIPAVRTVGLSLFASAGLAGIVAGLAARPAVSNLLAGVQLALTQPVRIGDAVLIEGEWGYIEEIGSTYVTVATWDQRSLIVPLAWLIERPVRNWTRSSSQILDTVYLHADYSVPVEALRKGAQDIVEGFGLWDGRVFAVQVTDLKERTMEIRVLLSAADASRMFDLRCLVREKLVALLAHEYPGALPRARVEIEEIPPQRPV
jgi:small-conductance mechanosensitive channel